MALIFHYSHSLFHRVPFYRKMDTVHKIKEPQLLIQSGLLSAQGLEVARYEHRTPFNEYIWDTIQAAIHDSQFAAEFQFYGLIGAWPIIYMFLT